jgi:hypothetical protein
MITPEDVRCGDYVEVWAVRASKDDPTQGFVLAWTDIDAAAFDAMLDRAARHSGYSVSSRNFHETRSRAICMQQQNNNSQRRVMQQTLLRARNVPGMPLQIRTFARTHRSMAAFPCDSPESAITVKVRRLELRMHARARLVFETRSSSSSSSSSSASCVRRAFIEIQLVPGASSIPDDLMQTVENSVRVVFLAHPGKRGKIVPNSASGGRI